MNINDLTKSQLLLLIFLVIFVTSFATAIVTVTLLDQSPKAGITQSINQVVERTIEKIVPGATTTIVRVEKVPVVVKEGELVVKAVEQAASSVLMLEKKTEDGWETVGSAIAVRGDGLLATSLKLIPPDPVEMVVRVGTGTTTWPVVPAYRDDSTQVAVLKIGGTSTPRLAIPKLSSDKLSFGQTVVGIGADSNGSPQISQGIVLGLVPAGTATSTLDIIRTNAVSADVIGGPIINTKGEVVGLAISRGYGVTYEAYKSIIDRIK